MELTNRERFDEVVAVIDKIESIDGVNVAGYEVQVLNPTHTGIQLTVGVRHD